MENPIIENVLSAGWEGELKKMGSVLDDLATKAEKINVALSNKGGKSTDTGQAKQIQELTLVVREYDATQKRMQATIKEMEAQKQKEITLSAQLNAATSKEAYNVAALTAAKREANSVTKLTVQLNTNEVGSLKAIEAQIGLNVIELNKYSAAQIEASARLKKMQVDTESLRNTQKTLNQATGNYKDSVGNYNSALTGNTKTMNSAYNSTFQMTQVMRELPNFAIDARIGFMSLSNNLPMLYDGFKQLANSIDAVTGKQQGWGYAFKTMGKSLLGMNTVMIVGVTLLTMYGKDIAKWIGTIGKAEKAVKDLVSAQGQLNEVHQKGAQDAQAETTKLGVLYEASQNQKLSINERTKAVDELQKKYPKYFGNLSNEAILLGNGKDAYDQLTESIYQNSIARASVDKITENTKAVLTIKEQIDWRKKYIATYQAEYDAYLKVQKETGKYGTFEAYYKGITEKIKIYGNEVTLLTKKIGGYDNANQKLKANIKPSDLIDPLEKERSVKTIEKEAEAYNKLALEMEVQINKAKELSDTDTLSFDERKTAVMSWFMLRQVVSSEDERVQKELLDKEYNEAKKNTKDRKALDEWYAQEKEKIALKSSNSYVAISEESEKMIEAINKDEAKSEKEKADEINKIRADMHKTHLGQLQDEIDKWNKIRKDELKTQEEQRQLSYDIAKLSVDLIAELGDSLIERQLDKLDEQNDAYKQSYDNRIKQIEGLGLSEEETTKEKAAAEAYYQSQLEQTKAREKELQREQFILNQLAALAQVAINTAINITSPTNIAGALTPYYIAIGAAQAAIIAAQTIPAFAEGGQVLGEGRISQSPNIPTRSNGDNILAYVRQGETILNNDQMLALGGAWAMKQAGVPGYEDVRYMPDIRDVRTGYTGKDGNIIVNANFESEKIVRKLDELIKVSSRDNSPKLMDTLTSMRYGKR